MTSCFFKLVPDTSNTTFLVDLSNSMSILLTLMSASSWHEVYPVVLSTSAAKTARGAVASNMKGASIVE